MKFKLAATLLVLTVLFSQKVSACTGILLNSTNDSIVTGRTVEFAKKLDMSVAVVPRNFQFVGQTPNGEGLTYTSKYGYAGIYCFNNKAIMDGMNEKGLVAAAFFFPGYAGYKPTTTQNQKNSISPVDFTNWILSQFSTIEEILSAISSVDIAPTVLEGWGSSPPPLHYVIYDSTGKSIVIEPINGELIVYDNLIGSMTNSPTFDWHVTNLNNYINLSTYNAKPLTVRGQKLEILGQGSGLNGLPGSFSSTSRFVRSSIFSVNAIPPTNARELPNQVFHILNQFDIPVGSVRENDQGTLSLDSTQVTLVKDPNTLRYYFKSYSDQTIRYIDLQEFNLNANSMKTFLIQGNQVNIDVSNLLQ